MRARSKRVAAQLIVRHCETSSGFYGVCNDISLLHRGFAFRFGLQFAGCLGEHL